MTLALTPYSLVYPVYRFPADNLFILLGLQKCGKWKGYLNGFGGKVQNNEGYHACARRELKEETGLIAEKGDLTLQGRIRYRHTTDDFLPGSVYVYFYENWDGKDPRGGELEGNMSNFSRDQLPFDRMPPDDQIWLPRMLTGNFVEAELTYETRRGEVLLKKVEFETSVAFMKPHMT